MFGQVLAVSLTALAFVPSAATVPPPSQPGPWQQVGKAATSRLGAKLHVSRTALDMKALAFVVTSRSPRRIQVSWNSYCEFESDDGYTEDYSGGSAARGESPTTPTCSTGRPSAMS
jgi:hypothetical protein